MILICEHHEDFVVCHGDEFKLVSVKHRDLSQGPWSWSALIVNGGLAHLFHRWVAFDGECSTCLATNGALSTGDATRLPLLINAISAGEELSDELSALLDDFTRRLWANTPPTKRKPGWKNETTWSDEFAALAKKFLSRLDVMCEYPGRDTMPHSAPSMYMEPLLRALGKDVSLAPAAWKAVSQLSRSRMQGRGKTTFGELGTMVSAYSGLSRTARLATSLEARVLSADDLLEAISVVEHAGIQATTYVTTIPKTRLAAKLVNSGCSATTVHAAESAAQRWRLQENSAQGDLPAMERLVASQADVLMLASHLRESLARASAGDFGPEMWLRIATDVESTGLTTKYGLDPVLLIGAVCDLASQCRVWFSPEFDISTAIDALPERLPEGAAA